jgi:crotonobetainyl-CoA:carnitine CoA-transferase CaiB-like acyl-CoA transferase
LGVGMWAMGQAVALSLVLGMPWTPPPADRVGSNPLSRNYETKDGRVLAFTCLQPAKYWPPLCETIGRPELATDPQFADYQSLMANSDAAVGILTEVFASATLAEWRERLSGFIGQWAVVQDTLEAAADPQTLANGYVQDCKTATGTPFRLVAAPVQFDEEPAVPTRAPEFNEHGDSILADMGFDEDAIIDLKIRGVVA